MFFFAIVCIVVILGVPCNCFICYAVDFLYTVLRFWSNSGESFTSCSLSWKWHLKFGSDLYLFVDTDKWGWSDTYLCNMYLYYWICRMYASCTPKNSVFTVQAKCPSEFNVHVLFSPVKLFGFFHDF